MSADRRVLLGSLLAEPAHAAELAPEEAAAALLELAALQAVLAARLRPVSRAGRAESQAPVEDRLLTAEEVAQRFGRSVGWVYRQARRWPFTRRETRKTLRFSEAGLLRHMAGKKG